MTLVGSQRHCKKKDLLVIGKRQCGICGYVFLKRVVTVEGTFGSLTSMFYKSSKLMLSQKLNYNSDFNP